MYRSQLLILMIKKSLLNIGIIVYVGIFLISINLFENNSSFTLSSGVQFVYAQDNRGGDGDGNGGSKGDGDGNGGSKGDGDGNGGSKGDGDGNGGSKGDGDVNGGSKGDGDGNGGSKGDGDGNGGSKGDGDGNGGSKGDGDGNGGSKGDGDGEGGSKGDGDGDGGSKGDGDGNGGSKGDGDGNGGSKGDGDGNGGSKGDGDGGDNNRNNDSKESGGNNKKNKSIVKDDNNIGQEILIVGEKSTCPTQSESVELSGIINPKGIRLLGDFYPCKIADGGVTLNIPEIPILKLAVMYIDYNGNNHAGALITPAKIQSIGENQGLFVIELDKNMKGINPITGQSTILTKINGLALYNNGDKPVVFKPGNIAALTATFTK